MLRARRSTVVGLCFALGIALVCGGADGARASLVLTSGLGTTHAGNLVVNGSFETGAPASGTANQLYWATGTSLTPFGVPPGWSSSGAATSYASWGNDGTPAIVGSDVFPDGNAGMYFGNGAPVLVSQPPTFHANGAVTFPSPPSFTQFFATAPVVLSQTINTPASPAPSYSLSFWVSGEGAVSGQQLDERGIFGLQITNVLPGDPIQFLTVPNGVNNGFGTSHLYEFTFTPLNPLLPVDVAFINWGHFDLSPHGGFAFTTELVLDDVIVNAVPEPGTLALVAIGLCAIASAGQRRPARE
ncbi:MAG: hypothetical protein DCC71_03230 [Proteobacteria bacterium]|nr:MAG: hypothetical protein DCC71_03230 [Pseudomonadota bacterium]